MSGGSELRAGPLGRYHALPVLVLALCNVVAFALLVVRGSRSAWGLVVAVGILLLVLPILWWWGLRVAPLLRVEGDRLHWASPLRAGSVRLASLVSVRPAPWPPGHMVFRTEEGASIVVLGGRRAAAFLEDLRRRLPDLEVVPRLLRAGDPAPRFRFDDGPRDAGR